MSLERTIIATSKDLWFSFVADNRVQGLIDKFILAFSTTFAQIMIFQVATSLSIFSTTRPSLAQYKKQVKGNYVFTYAN